MQGANRSKVEYLARIGNAAETVLWCKIRRNTQYKQPRSPCTPRENRFQAALLLRPRSGSLKRLRYNPPFLIG